MRVLVTEQRPGASDNLVRQLRELGCEVSTCHDATAICTAMAPGRRCPLDSSSHVDLFVDVHSGGSELAVREFGAVCAIRAKRPVFVVSPKPDRRPTVPWGLGQQATAIRSSALLTACADALRTEELVRSGPNADPAR